MLIEDIDRISLQRCFEIIEAGDVSLEDQKVVKAINGRIYNLLLMSSNPDKALEEIRRFVDQLMLLDNHLLPEAACKFTMEYTIDHQEWFSTEDFNRLGFHSPIYYSRMSVSGTLFEYINVSMVGPYITRYESGVPTTHIMSPLTDKGPSATSGGAIAKAAFLIDRHVGSEPREMTKPEVDNFIGELKELSLADLFDKCLNKLISEYLIFNSQEIVEFLANRIKTVLSSNNDSDLILLYDFLEELVDATFDEVPEHVLRVSSKDGFDHYTGELLTHPTVNNPILSIQYEDGARRIGVTYAGVKLLIDDNSSQKL